MEDKYIRVFLGCYYKYGVKRPIYKSVKILNKPRKNEINKHLKEYVNKTDSYFNLEKQETYELIEKSIGKGKGRRVSDNSYEEVIDAGRIIGTVRDENGNEYPTQYFLIKYSMKYGYHAYPVRSYGKTK